MKWIGYISSAVVLNVAFFGIYLWLVGRFPSHELKLAWQAIVQPPAESGVEPPRPSPPETPSYEDLLEERLLRSPEIARKIEELNSVRRAVEQERLRLDAARAQLEALQKGLAGAAASEIEAAQRQGEQKLLDLATAMKPKQAKEVLISDPDQDRVLRLILKMDPSSAEKIFREFKQPDEQRTLNGWLNRLGQGDPEATRLRQLMEQARRVARD
jgi:hypothetical protein